MKGNANKFKEIQTKSEWKPIETTTTATSVSSSYFLAGKMEKSKSCRSAAVVWDCGSSLYDSFELNSLKRQLDSAIASRTLSMPHLPGRRSLLDPPPPPSKRPSKISRSLHKLLRSVFRQKSADSSPGLEDGLYVLCGDEASSISAIPEVGLSPEIGSLVRRTASERFTAPTSVGISCSSRSVLG